MLTSCIIDLSSDDLVCNKDALSGTDTDVIPASIGDEVIFTLDTVCGLSLSAPISYFHTNNHNPGRVPPGTPLHVRPRPELDEVFDHRELTPLIASCQRPLAPSKNTTARTAGESFTTGVRTSTKPNQVKLWKKLVANHGLTGPEGQNWDMSRKTIPLSPVVDAYLPCLSETYSFTIPDCVPDGEYLLRIQSLAIHNPYPAGIPQVRLISRILQAER